jgi:hypothetical protein
MQRKIIPWVLGGVILLIVGIVVVSSLSMYVKRGMSGRMRLTSSELGVPYEPTYIANEAQKVSTPRAWSSQKIEVIPAVRKLIRKGELSLEVKNCVEVSAKIMNLVNSFSGIIIDSQIQKYPNESKRGRAVLKVLPENFEIVFAKLKEFGKVDLEHVTAEDVTEEYVDLEARLKNCQVVRERLLRILDERAREVKDILDVERELARLGEQIERIEGRMK